MAMASIALMHGIPTLLLHTTDSMGSVTAQLLATRFFLWTTSAGLLEPTSMSWRAAKELESCSTSARLA
jgi:hypothetical protein